MTLRDGAAGCGFLVFACGLVLVPGGAVAQAPAAPDPVARCEAARAEARRRAAEKGPQDVNDVRDFGAVGDGHADDYVAFQAALDAVFTHSKDVDRTERVWGGLVRVPHGRYAIGCPLQVPGWGAYAAYTPNHSSVVVSLHPAATLDFRYDGPDGRALFELDDNCARGSVRLEGGRLTGMTLVPRDRGQAGIRIRIQGVTVRDMLIDGFPGDGIALEPPVPPRRGDVVVNRIEDCHVFDNGGSGIRALEGTALVVDRCRIESNGQFGVFLRGNGISVTSNTIEGNGGADRYENLRLEETGGGVTDASITNNYVHDRNDQSRPTVAIVGGPAAPVQRAFFTGNYLVGSVHVTPTGATPLNVGISIGDEPPGGAKPGAAAGQVRNATVLGNFFLGHRIGILLGPGAMDYHVGPNGFGWADEAGHKQVENRSRHPGHVEKP